MTPADLKSWRTSRGLKSSELAAALGVSRAAVSRWENGRFEIPRSVELALKELERTHDAD